MLDFDSSTRNFKSCPKIAIVPESFWATDANRFLVPADKDFSTDKSLRVSIDEVMRTANTIFKRSNKHIHENWCYSLDCEASQRFSKKSDELKLEIASIKCQAIQTSVKLLGISGHPLVCLFPKIAQQYIEDSTRDFFTPSAIFEMVFEDQSNKVFAHTKKNDSTLLFKERSISAHPSRCDFSY
jgi:hypothetical protein